MIQICGKTYKYIYWDWLDTLYSSSTQELFDWVEEFFSNYGESVDHFLFSYNLYPEKRKQLISTFNIAKYFKNIEIFADEKEKHFAKVMETYKHNKSDILVIGDNINNEIAAAKNLGIDFLIIDEFVRNLSSVKSIAGE